ncbi:hypothetical protein CDL15_Pgr016351 [Punica granatum]|uniref:Uncharacterized protein n=1 Tax=Punica granatum TaxID=22663 RepID=A0A218W7G2_PUNGR|nr:hypothetical protein CDL15_Pgr016351 [Punica granatum]
MVLFSKSVPRQQNADAADTYSRWLGTTNLCSLIGTFLSDSYLGRFRSCAILSGCLCHSSLCTYLFLLKPQGCGKVGELCQPHCPLEVALFYISIYLVAIGFGAPEPSLATFGVDQFDREDPDEQQSKSSFYSYYYVAVNMGCLVAQTVLSTSKIWAIGWLCFGFALVFL